jgi:hypothetical protein
MAVGSYGTIRPADVSPADVDIYYQFVTGRTSSAPVTFTKLVSTNILTPVFHNGTTGGNADKEILGGLYNLKLDSNVFTDIGIYTMYMRPKQIRTTIMDCGVLASLPSVRGIIVDIGNVPSDDVNKFTPQGLVGYRIEYLDDSGAKVPNFYRVVTSSFYCTPVTSNLSNSNQKAIRYVYSDVPTNLMFLTVTPSSSPSSRPNTIPFIGQPDQNIIICNTYFNPTMIEIEFVEHDVSTLAYALYGNQSKSIVDGVYTIYDDNNNIYKQYNLYEIKDDINQTLFEIREKKTNIDQSKDFNIITE